MLRSLPGDARRIDVAADILPLSGDALIAGWTTVGDSAADGFVLRIDREGRQQWRRHFGGTGSDLLFSLQPDGNRGFVAAGLTTSRGEGGDGWLLALDAEGHVRWERNFGGAGHDRLTALSALPSGDGWLAAGQRTGAGSTHAWVLRLDREGRETAQWTWGDTGAVSRAFGIEALPDDGAVIVGLVESTRGDADGFATRLDCDGVPLWTHRIQGLGRELAYHVRARNERFLVTGYGEFRAGRDHDAFVRQLDGGGRSEWTVALGDSSTERGVQSVLLEDFSSVVVAYRKPTAAASDGPVWTTFLHGLDAAGRTTWTMPLGRPGRESGRWIASSRGDLWIVGQEATEEGGSRVFVARLELPPR